MLTSVEELGIGYRRGTRYIFLEGWEALSHIERFSQEVEAASDSVPAAGEAGKRVRAAVATVWSL
jgi:hypothetical protein